MGLSIVNTIVIFVIIAIALVAAYLFSGSKRPCPHCRTMMSKKVTICPHCHKTIPLGY